MTRNFKLPSFTMAQSGGRVLLVSSLAAAQDGSYQSAVKAHQDAGAVLETEMIDRITDNGTSFADQRCRYQRMLSTSCTLLLQMTHHGHSCFFF